jgi:hypothetical protein
VLTNDTVRYLPLADQFIVLEAGGNVQQIGTFDELSHCDGYVQNLGLDKETTAEPEIENTTQTLQKPPPLVDVLAKAEAKQNGPISAAKDTGIYHFYASSIGLWRISVLLGAAVLLAFSTKFPRQSQPVLFLQV